MEIGRLEETIGYTFRNKELIYQALSHSSYANERKHPGGSNERLEFLGDSVLSIVVSDYLYKNLNVAEGELTKLRASLVCEKSLHIFARQIHLGDYLMLGKGEENTGGRERPSILADAFEAVIAAIYLDGGLEAAAKHILHFMPEDIKVTQKPVFSDFKTVLQEIVQKNPVHTGFRDIDMPSHSGPVWCEDTVRMICIHMRVTLKRKYVHCNGLRA